MKTPIDKLMDAQHIKRWAIVGTVIENNVAVHSFNVAMLAMDIHSRLIDAHPYNRFTEKEVCYYSLIHDIIEVYTGDIPTPTKVKMREAGLDINTFDPQVEAEHGPPAELKQLIKAADLIDNCIFIAEYGIGTRAKSAHSEVMSRLLDHAARVPPCLGEAMMVTYNYVSRRMSDVIEEGRRAEANSKKVSQGSQGAVPGLRPVVG